MNELRRVAELGGFFAAHGIWSVSDGEALVPFCAVESHDGARALTRFAADRLEVGVEQARAFFAQPPGHCARAVLVYDGYVTLEWGKTDALIVEARSLGTDASFTMLVPYRSGASGFAVFRPKLVALSPSGTPEIDVAHEFFAGVESHASAAAVWNAHLDQSK